MFKYMGIIGLALALSFQYALSALMMVTWLQRQSVVSWTGKEFEV
jgi:Na+-driven multidrug efflux pump